MRMHFQILKISAVAVATAALTIPARADKYSYTLAGQQEFSLKRGFSLGVEVSGNEVPAPLDKAKLVLSVADGQAWRFPSFSGPWEWDRDYKVRATIGPSGSSLWLDGKLVADSPGAFMPSSALKVLRSGLLSRNTGGTSGFLVQQTQLRISTPGLPTLNEPFNKPENWLKPSFLLEPQTPVKEPWTPPTGQEFTVEVSFRFVPVAPSVYAPFVDKFGQNRHADWPSKIHNDAEFQRATVEEKQRNATWGVSGDYDEFGGYTKSTWKETATGFFRTVRHNGYWWLISPAGNPCFYVGMDDVNGTWENTQVTNRETLFADLPPRQGDFAAAWNEQKGIWRFNYNIANSIRKYGADWQLSCDRSAAERLKTWGFSGAGKWSGVTNAAHVVTQPVLRRSGVPTIGRLPDIFNPETQATFRAVLDKLITPEKNNPYVLGWSLGNEYDEIVLKSDVLNFLKQPGTVPVKAALVKFAVDQLYHGDATALNKAWKLEGETAPQPPSNDVEALRQYYAHQYYGFIYDTVKQLDPNHLYFGFWINMGWWENEEDWKLIGAHCDVIGYDDYRATFDDDRYERLSKATDKPTLCGEMSFPSWYQGQRGYGVFGAAPPEDASAGRMYAAWLDGAAHDPYTIGNHWFQYRDQPLTGRGPQTGSWLTQGEHYAFGIVDIADQPKWELVTAMRTANLSAVQTRLHATGVNTK